MPKRARARVKSYLTSIIITAVLTMAAAGCTDSQSHVSFSAELVSGPWPADLAPDRPIATWIEQDSVLRVYVMQGYEEDCPIEISHVMLESPRQVVVEVAEVPMPCAAVGSLLQVTFELPDGAVPNEMQIDVLLPSGTRLEAPLN